MDNMVFAVLFSVLAGYLVGGINPSYILSRLKGFDIRTRGSGNAGASNAIITLGKTAGVFCALFDILKAYGVINFVTRVLPSFKYGWILTGSSCILGHMYPLFMKFRGGKGLACLAGMLLAYDSKIFVVVLAFEVVFALITTYICSIATSGSLIIGGLMLVRDGLFYALLFVPVIVAVWRKHLVNFRRIRYGVEAKISYLWNKSKETQRVQNNWDALNENQRNYVGLLELKI